ncbi:hypothetical protein MKW98_005190 [Papaver atlanticum]|uniref:Small ribosomal subunit protein bS18c n=1 Tax=Papaver atlanticum TaxID=357466 RepID=A0AAD4X4M5_9MAGN|nr:hypothetical protein MKW98_005190 [Papaver atlanticum]
MNLIRVGAKSVSGGLSGQCRQPWMIRNFSSAGHSGNVNDDNRSSKSFESSGDFERRIFSGISGSNQNTDSFYQKLDKLGPRGRSGFGARSDYQSMDNLDENFNSLSDGMDGKLKKAANYFGFNYDELEKEDYAYRPDVNFRPGATYETKDLDIRRAGVWKPFQREEFTTTTEDVLKYADFRNVRFLANFITEAGIIEKRSKFKISAKAQRKIAREIKISRALGLMPFTTMGQDPFVPGKSRLENEDEEYDYYSRPSGRGFP